MDEEIVAYIHIYVHTYTQWNIIVEALISSFMNWDFEALMR